MAFTAVFALGSMAQKTIKQEYISVSQKVPAKKIGVLSIEGCALTEDKGTATASLEWYVMEGDNRLAVLKVSNAPKTLKLLQQAKPYKKIEFSWTGTDLKLKKIYYSDGSMNYWLMRGNERVLVFGNYKENGAMHWGAAVTLTPTAATVDNVYLGMTLDELKDVIAKDMPTSSLKHRTTSAKTGEKGYSLLWIGEEYNYTNLDGTDHYTIDSTHEYGYFYFNSQGKLTRWYMDNSKRKF